MRVYLVGGAVRDRLLGHPITERDWVVIGETPESMLAQGFKPVGKDFPVFLHPQTHEEYALARTERKIAPGYRGFAINSAPDVSLEEDLSRRDLTINAIAMAKQEAEHLIDPFGGQRDLQLRLLRHVSAAFVEDPVRILRVARFKARYDHLGFDVAEETMELMKNMVENGEADALVPERVWSELAKALSERTPTQFFYVLQDCGALNKLFPELDQLFGVPQPVAHHPEIDTGLHTMMVLEQAARISDDPIVRFAALTHDLGKALTPADEWPRHHGHEQKGLSALENLCNRLAVPKEYKKLAQKVMRFHGRCHRVFELRASTLVDTLQSLNALKKNQSLEPFLLACEADARGRKGLESKPYPQANFFLGAQKAALSVETNSLIKQGLRNQEIGQRLRELRIEAVDAYKIKRNS